MKSRSARAVRPVDHRVPVGQGGNANSCSSRERSPLERPEQRGLEHVPRHLDTLSERPTLRTAHESTPRDEKARIINFSVRVRDACREKAPKTSMYTVSAISAVCSGESPSLTIASCVSSGVSGASDMMPVSHGWSLEACARVRVMQGRLKGKKRLRTQSRR